MINEPHIKPVDPESFLDRYLARASTGLESGFTHAFIASLSVIIVSEIADKTFFIAAIMAMRHSRVIVFTGAITALAVMTILSGWIEINKFTNQVALISFFLSSFSRIRHYCDPSYLYVLYIHGVVCNIWNKDAARRYSLFTPPQLIDWLIDWLIRYLFIAWLINWLIDWLIAVAAYARNIGFYVRFNSFSGYYMSNDEGQEEMEEVQADLKRREDEFERKINSQTSSSDIEAGAMRTLTSRKLKLAMQSHVFWEALSLTFLAEWGDRSQLATIILGAREVTIKHRQIVRSIDWLIDWLIFY